MVTLFFLACRSTANGCHPCYVIVPGCVDNDAITIVPRSINKETGLRTLRMMVAGGGPLNREIGAICYPDYEKLRELFPSMALWRLYR